MPSTRRTWAGWGFGSRDKEAENPSAHFSEHSVCQGPWCHSCVSWCLDDDVWMYSFETELECYLSEPVIERSDMPLQWLQKNETRFKTLAHLANQFLCHHHPLCLGWSTERMFSEVDMLYEARRSRLTGHHAHQLCFLHYNLRLLNFEY